LGISNQPIMGAHLAIFVRTPILARQSFSIYQQHCDIFIPHFVCEGVPIMSFRFFDGVRQWTYCIWMPAFPDETANFAANIPSAELGKLDREV
jgi:hypothetical protein